MVIKAPVKSSSEVLDQESAVKAFNRTWDGYAEPVLNRYGSELKQIQEMLEAYLKKIFGVNYCIGFFSERDISSKQGMGYIPLTIGKFPKKTWSDGIAMSMKLNNEADGTIRWGSRGELMACVIPEHIRAKNQQQERISADAVMNRHLKKGKRSKKNNDGAESSFDDVVITQERERPLRKI